MLFSKRFLFSVLFIRSLIGLSVDIQVQDRVFEPEIVNSYKTYINTGISCDEKGEVLDAQQKADFIRNIFQWVADFLPNELGNLHVNLEKSTLYAKLLLDRKSDLITHNIITHDELERHNSICQNFFRDFFGIAAQTTIDPPTRELINDAFSLWNKLRLPTTQASYVKFEPFFSTLEIPPPKKNKVNPIGSLPFTVTLESPTNSRPFFQNINEPAPNTVNPIGISVEYPMTHFIMQTINNTPNLSAIKLENIKRKVDLLKIVEDLSGSLLEGKNKDLFRKFEVQLTQRNITTIKKKNYTASELCSAFLNSFIEPLKKTETIRRKGNRLELNKILVDDQKKIIEHIIKWKKVFCLFAEEEKNNIPTQPLIVPILDVAKYPMTDFIITKIKENNELSPKELKNLEKRFYLLEIVEDLSGHLSGVSDENLFKNFNTELNKKIITISDKEKFTASLLASTFWNSFIEPLKKKKHIISNGRLAPSDSLPEDQKNMIKCIIKWRNVFFNTHQKSKP